MKNKNTLGFTIAELIIVLMLLAILGTISFVSFTGYSGDARDSVRITDLKHIETALETYHSSIGNYPTPNNPKAITYKGAMIWEQGSFGNNAFAKVKVLNSLPLDPSFGNEYSYSILNTGNQYELVGILEKKLVSFNQMQVNATSKSTAYAYTSGNYNRLLSKVSTGGIDYILAIPSITVNNLSSLNIIDIINNKNLVYNNYTNLPVLYKSSNFKIDGGFDFSPNNLVIFSGSLIDLGEGYNQVNFLKNFQSSYSGTIIKTDDNLIKNIGALNINPLLPGYKAKLLACDVIKFKLRYDVDCEGLDYIATILEEIIVKGGLGGGESSITNILFNLPGEDIKSIFIDSAGGYWFGTDKGVAYYNLTTWQVFNKDNSSLINNEVTGITQDLLGNYWFGTEKGVSKLLPDLITWVTYTNKDMGLKKSDIQYIYTSVNGTVWVGTEKKGAASFINGAWDTYKKLSNHQGLSSNKINTIFEDSNYNIWFGTDNNGVDKMKFISNTPLLYDQNTINYKPSNTSGNLPDKDVTYILEDVNNNMWFGTKSGLGRLNSNGNWAVPYNSINSPAGLYSDKITYLFEDNSNNIWVGTKSGVGRLDNDGVTWTHYGISDPISNKLKSDKIISIYEDTSGNILILGDKGMDTIDLGLQVNPSNI